MIRHLIPVLGDQLSTSLASLRDADRERDLVLMCEVHEESTYVKHHRKKIAFVLAAMRHFAEVLRADGWRVEYRTLPETGDAGSFTSEIERAVRLLKPERIVVTSPGEWRVLAAMRTWRERFGVPVEIREDDRFLCSTRDFEAWAAGRKQLRMEYFYREMRRLTGLLMDGTEPVGGAWNFDAENRRPARRGTRMPTLPRFEPDAITRDVLSLVAERFTDHFGDLEPFGFAVTRSDALVALEHFCTASLPSFGDDQDAMLEGESFLHHSVLSPYLNVGLLSPLEVCRRAEQEYRAGRAPIASVEGFIRQVLGWREYVRGIYWREMPGYLERDHFAHTRPVPGFYWTGETDMACLRAAIGQTKREAYAHHIQRLMLTGNFALLAGVSPHALHEWYLSVYVDAFEWVEAPNTIGMSQFADGGLLASKPYVSSGAYIARMSDHCRQCRYDVKAPHGEQACPFNALYWAFLVRHRATLAGNPRMAQMYRTWDRLDEERRTRTLASAEAFLARLDRGE
jgi:deoxyribodipyrimidine photolyase-related protein